jgi:tetratricopeptide (TPR) repeat protein
MSKIDEAEREKELGNRTFLNGNHAAAIDHYSAAIELNSKVATYYSNRSACYSKMKAYDKAMEDAAKCIEIDPSFLKGYYRLAIAHEGRNHLKLAIKTLQTASTFQLHSKNPEILSKLQDLQKKLAHQKRVIGKEVLRLCRLSRWESLPVLFTRTTRIRIHDQDLDDDDEYSESVAHWYSTAYPGEADLEIRCSGSQMTPLLFAVSSGAVSTINLLLQHGACADLAMPVAIAYLQPNSIRELLRHGYGIDRDAFSYLVAPNPYNTWFTSSSQDFDILLNMESMSEVAKTTNSLGVKVYIPQLDELLDR